MSAGPAMPFDEVAPRAVELLRLLEPACSRVKIAGSLRRRRTWVRDIELVAIARIEEVRSVETGLFDAVERVDVHNRLAELLERLRSGGTLAARDVEIHRRSGTVEHQHRLGEKHQQLEYAGIPVDLFITTPESWGVILALRTGSHEWNVELVSRIRRYHRQVAGGRLLHLGRPVETLEEADFFRACGVPWVEPKDREVYNLRIDPSLFAEPVPA